MEGGVAAKALLPLLVGLVLVAAITWTAISALSSMARYETVETWCGYLLPKRGVGVSAQGDWRWRGMKYEYECIFYGENGREIGRRPAPRKPPWRKR